MATQRSSSGHYSLNPEVLHEIVLRAIDDAEGCFLSNLSALLAAKGIFMAGDEFVSAVGEAVRTYRLLLQVQLNGTNLDLFMRTKHYHCKSVSHEQCDDPVCDTCHPEIFS